MNKSINQATMEALVTVFKIQKKKIPVKAVQKYLDKGWINSEDLESLKKRGFVE